MIEADINPSTLSLNLACLFQPISCIRLQNQTRTGEYPYSKIDNAFSIDFIGKTSTTTFNLYNKDRLNISYLKSLTSHFIAGTEILFESIKGQLRAYTSVAFRYIDFFFDETKIENINFKKYIFNRMHKEKYNLTVTANTSQSFNMQYWRQVHDSIQIGSSLILNLPTSKAIGSIFYQWEFKDVYIRGLIDSDGSVGFTYNKFVVILQFNSFNIINFFFNF